METAGLLLLSWVGVLKTYWIYILVIMLADIYMLHTTRKRFKKARRALAYSIAIESVVMVGVPLVGFFLLGG